MGVEQEGVPFGARQGEQLGPAVDGSLAAGSAEDEGPRVARVLEHLQRARPTQRYPDQLPPPWAAELAVGEEQALPAEAADDRARRTGALEGLEEQMDGGLDLAVGIQRHLAVGCIDEPDGKEDLEFAPAGFGVQAAYHPRPQHMEFCLAQGAFEAE